MIMKSVKVRILYSTIVLIILIGYDSMVALVDLSDEPLGK